MNSSPYIAFVDESGDHNLNPLKLDNIYNVFVLGAISFKRAEYAEFDSAFRNLKKHFFGTDDFVIHTAEITRPSKSSNSLNLRFNDSTFRRNFYEQMNSLIDKSNFKISFCAIMKDQYKDEYAHNLKDPYHVAFESVLNKLIQITDSRGIEILPEKRGFPEDNKLQIEILRLQTVGTQYFSPKVVRDGVSSVDLVDKKANLSGSQLIDLVVSPIGRHLLGYSPKPVGNEIQYNILKNKVIFSEILPQILDINNMS